MIPYYNGSFMRVGTLFGFIPVNFDTSNLSWVGVTSPLAPHGLWEFSRPEIEFVLSAVKAWNPNYLTTWEFPGLMFSMCFQFFQSLTGGVVVLLRKSLSVKIFDIKVHIHRFFT